MGGKGRRASDLRISNAGAHKVPINSRRTCPIWTGDPGPGVSREFSVRVLVVEDETLLANVVARGLRREGMAIDVAGDGGSALRKT